MEKYEPLKQIKNIKTGYPERKVCIRCNKELLTENYHKDKHTKDGLISTCISCKSGKSHIDFEKKCKGCGNKFTTRKELQVYCSFDCSPKSKKTYKDRNCIICDSVFTPKSLVHKCCSFNCKVKKETQDRSNKPKIRKCASCSNEFVPYTSLDKYCSFDCRLNNKKSKRKRNWTKEQVLNRYGKNNPSYRHGMYIEGSVNTSEGLRFFDRNKKEIKEQMIDDLGYIYCEHCKTTNSIKFESHHIVFRSEKPHHEHLHDKVNILHLCIKCHNEFHKHKGLRNDIVVERKLNELFGDDILNKNVS